MLKRLLSFSGRYRILHLTWFAFLLSFVVIFNAAPLAESIIEEFQLNELQFRTMLLCNLALAIPFRIIFGMLVDRIGPSHRFFRCLSLCCHSLLRVCLRAGL